MSNGSPLIRRHRELTANNVSIPQLARYLDIRLINLYQIYILSIDRSDFYLLTVRNCTDDRIPPNTSTQHLN